MYMRVCGLHEGMWCIQGGVDYMRVCSVCTTVCGVHKRGVVYMRV